MLFWAYSVCSVDVLHISRVRHCHCGCVQGSMPSYVCTSVMCARDVAGRWHVSVLWDISCVVLHNVLC